MEDIDWNYLVRYMLASCVPLFFNSFDDVSNKDNILTGPEGTQRDFIVIKSSGFNKHCINFSDYLCFYVLKEAVIKQGGLRIKEKQQKEGKPLQHN